MLFPKKYKRGLEVMQEKNREYLDSLRNENTKENSQSSDELLSAEEKAREFHEEEIPELEKGDLPAMIISAMLVFGPIILALTGILAVFWIVLH